MDSTEELLDQIVRLQALQIRLGFPNQADAIREFGKTGLSPSRIAELLGTTSATVRVALHREKGKPRAKKSDSSGGG